MVFLQLKRVDQPQGEVQQDEERGELSARLGLLLGSADSPDDDVDEDQLEDDLGDAENAVTNYQAGGEIFTFLVENSHRD